MAQVSGPKALETLAPGIGSQESTHTNNSSSIEVSSSVSESFQSFGLGELITSRHRGKRPTSSSLQKDASQDLTLIPSTPAPTPASSSSLPMEDIPPAWLEERIGDFPART